MPDGDLRSGSKDLSTGAVARPTTVGLAPERAAGAAWARQVAGVLFVVSAAALIAALVVSLYNVRYSYERINALARVASEAGSEPAVAVAETAMPAWVRPLMKDLSVVSPALTAFTFACMALAALSLAWSSAPQRSGGEHFPFPTTYKTYYIQMGLLGTIVGFVIAFSDIDPRAEGQSQILIDALGTALWSTLSAIFLAYVVCPVVEIGYQRLRVASVGPLPADTRSALDALRQRTVDATESLSTLTRSTRALRAETEALSVELGERRLESQVARLQSEVAAMAAALDQLGGKTADLTEQSDAALRASRGAEARIHRVEEGLAKHDGDLRDLTQVAAHVRRSEERLSQHDDGLQRLKLSLDAAVRSLDDVRSVAERLEREQVVTEGDRKRLEALEKWARALGTFGREPD